MNCAAENLVDASMSCDKSLTDVPKHGNQPCDAQYLWGSWGEGDGWPVAVDSDPTTWSDPTWSDPTWSDPTWAFWDPTWWFDPTWFFTGDPSWEWNYAGSYDLGESKPEVAQDICSRPPKETGGVSHECQVSEETTKESEPVGGTMEPAPNPKAALCDAADVAECRKPKVIEPVMEPAPKPEAALCDAADVTEDSNNWFRRNTL